MHHQLTESEQECLVNPNGAGYLGTTQVAASGQPCLPWVTNVHILPLMTIPDEFGRDASNYCRYIPGLNWMAPSCLVNIGSDTISHVVNMSCAIPYCRKSLIVSSLRYWFKVFGVCADTSINFIHQSI